MEHNWDNWQGNRIIRRKICTGGSLSPTNPTCIAMVFSSGRRVEILVP
jgi:hypothetical protein